MKNQYKVGKIIGIILIGIFILLLKRVLMIRLAERGEIIWLIALVIHAVMSVFIVNNYIENNVKKNILMWKILGLENRGIIINTIFNDIYFLTLWLVLYICIGVSDNPNVFEICKLVISGSLWLAIILELSIFYLISSSLIRKLLTFLLASGIVVLGWGFWIILDGLINGIDKIETSLRFIEYPPLRNLSYVYLCKGISIPVLMIVTFILFLYERRCLKTCTIEYRNQAIAIKSRSFFDSLYLKRNTTFDCRLVRLYSVMLRKVLIVILKIAFLLIASVLAVKIHEETLYFGIMLFLMIMIVSLQEEFYKTELVHRLNILYPSWTYNQNLILNSVSGFVFFSGDILVVYLIRTVFTETYWGFITILLASALLNIYFNILCLSYFAKMKKGRFITTTESLTQIMATLGLFLPVIGLILAIFFYKKGKKTWESRICIW